MTTTADSGSGSLRSAIQNANSNPGYDEIEFDISGPGVHSITLNSALPPLTSPVFIDGYSQNGSEPNWVSEFSSATILIEINGNNLGVTGFDFANGSSGSSVFGLAMNRFSDALYDFKVPVVAIKLADVISV